jgi:hypothetical protein
MHTRRRRWEAPSLDVLRAWLPKLCCVLYTFREDNILYYFLVNHSAYIIPQSFKEAAFRFWQSFPRFCTSSLRVSDFPPLPDLRMSLSLPDRVKELRHQDYSKKHLDRDNTTYNSSKFSYCVPYLSIHRSEDSMIPFIIEAFICELEQPLFLMTVPFAILAKRH